MTLIWLLIIALGLVAAVLVGVFVVAQRDFREHISRLQCELEHAPAAVAARADLPPEVRALAQRLGASSPGRARLVLLTQSGEMWMKPGAQPLGFTATQTFAVADVGFLWRARFRMAGATMGVIDYVVGAEAGLEGRLLGALPIVRVGNNDSAYRGEAMRYLAELLWVPDALLFNAQLDWRVINARTLAVGTGSGARRCEVRLILNESGDPVHAEADDRPRVEGGVVTSCPWFARGGDYQTIGGRRIPTRGEAGWILDGIEFVYFRARIESWSLIG